MFQRIEFVMVAIKRSPKVKARIKERMHSGLCLGMADDGTDCDRPSVCNGNCSMHDQRARRNEAKLTSISARKAFRDELYRQGLRLSPQEVREFKTKDVYARIACDMA